MEIGSKNLSAVELGRDDQGDVVAIVGTLDVVDRDADVIPSTAFTSGTSVILSAYGHSSVLAHARGSGVPVEPPAGKGLLTIEGGKAIFRGSFFMSTARGKEAFLTAKAMGSSQEWSHTFFIRKADPPTPAWRSKGARQILSDILPFEVSPVTIGGSVGTRTVSTKGAAQPLDAATVREIKGIARDVEGRALAAAEGWYGTLARDLAAKSVRWLTDGAEQWTPVVKFFSGGGDVGGYWTPGESGVIHVRRGLDPIELARVIGHEVSHALRPWDRGEAVPTAAGNSVADRFLRTLED